MLFLLGFMGAAFAVAMVIWGFTAGTDSAGEPNGPDGWGMMFSVTIGFGWLVACWVLGLFCFLGFGVAEATRVRHERRVSGGRW